MSGATYRIELEHTPGEGFLWYGRVYELADDGLPVYTKHGDDAGTVESACRAWIDSQHTKAATITLWTDDYGHQADPPSPHSVKV